MVTHIMTSTAPGFAKLPSGNSSAVISPLATAYVTHINTDKIEEKRTNKNITE